MLVLSNLLDAAASSSNFSADGHEGCALAHLFEARQPLAQLPHFWRHGESHNAGNEKNRPNANDQAEDPRASRLWVIR